MPCRTRPPPQLLLSCRTAAMFNQRDMTYDGVSQHYTIFDCKIASSNAFHVKVEETREPVRRQRVEGYICESADDFRRVARPHCSDYPRFGPDQERDRSGRLARGCPSAKARLS